MYLQSIDGVLQSYEVKIKYDCDGGFEKCGQEVILKFKYAEKKNIPFVVVLGTTELQGGTCNVKNIQTGEQKTIPQAELVESIF